MAVKNKTIKFIDNNSNKLNRKLKQKRSNPIKRNKDFIMYGDQIPKSMIDMILDCN